MTMARKVDRNSMRAGAGVSAAVLLLAYVVDVRALVPAVTVALAIGALLGLRASPLGLLYRALKKGLSLRIPVEPEDEPPPRFAQALGATFLTVASIALYGPGADVLGWGLALLVAVLQGLLALSGICVGCEMYLLAKRLTAKQAA